MRVETKGREMSDVSAKEFFERLRDNIIKRGGSLDEIFDRAISLTYGIQEKAKTYLDDESDDGRLHLQTLYNTYTAAYFILTGSNLTKAQFKETMRKSISATEELKAKA